MPRVYADDEYAPRTHIRTFKLRTGRLTLAQADAIDRLWPAHGVAVDGTPLDLDGVFGRSAPVVLEIGFGMGEATAAMAAADPARDLLAVDVHTPGLGNLLRLAEVDGLSNLRVACGDAVILVRDMLSPRSLDEIRVFFPDPWPKARHAKRRLLTPDVIDLMVDRLRVEGRLHVATDWTPYAEQVRAIMSEHPLLRLEERSPHRATTRFESQGVAAGRQVHDLSATRQDAPGA